MILPGPDHMASLHAFYIMFVLTILVTHNFLVDFSRARIRMTWFVSLWAKLFILVLGSWWGVQCAQPSSAWWWRRSGGSGRWGTFSALHRSLGLSFKQFPLEGVLGGAGTVLNIDGHIHAAIYQLWVWKMSRRET